MVRFITCNVFHMRHLCRFFDYLAWYDIVEFNCLPSPNNEMYDHAVFADRFLCQLSMFGIQVLIGYLDSFMLVLHMIYILTKSSQHSTEFPIVCTIWYGWIQSFAMFKKQHVRWCGFRWSIPISIDYVWSVYIDMAIYTLWYSYCIWNSYIKKSPLVTGLMRKTIYRAGL